MNRISTLKWIEKTGACVAVSEITKSVGKKPSSRTTAIGAYISLAVKALTIFVLMSFGTDGNALPIGGVVTAGDATISNGATSTTINQSTQNAVINWQSFNIGQKEAVQFVQPNSSSVALNRVLGSDPSSILGSLSANGKVFLLNPNGVLFGKGAQVNVGGLVASTHNITDSDFMAGRYQFTGAGNGKILNQGSINANGGYVALLGANVSNEGVILAKLGTVALAAGNAITLDVAGDGLLNVTVNQGIVNALVQNGGMIQADGGQVLMTTQGAEQLLQSVVNNTGVIHAQTIENHNGTIRLLGDMQSGTVNVSGTLDVSGKGAGQTGGSVTVTGHHVGLFDKAKIDASGDAGGGTVLIGSDLQGVNSAAQNASATCVNCGQQQGIINTNSVQNATATYMSEDAIISADAITNGSGGKVVLWANDSTRAYGSITARGGSQAGNGGLIETSGHWLDVSGISINASAPNGKNGMWLLDPADVTITLAGPTTGGAFAGGVFTPDLNADTAVVAVADITTPLIAGTNVTINTANTFGSGNGDINVDAAISWTKAAGIAPASILTLTAVRDVVVNSAITATYGSLVGIAGRDVNVYEAITITSGTVTFCADRDINIVKDGTHLASAITTTGGATIDGNLTAIAGRNVNIDNAKLTTTGGDVFLSGGYDNTANTALVGGTVNFTSSLLADRYTVTGHTRSGADAIVTVNYTPASYSVPTNYTNNFTLTDATLTPRMLVFPNWTKVHDGTTTATASGFLGNPLPTNVSLVTGTSAVFDTASIGVNKTVTYVGYGLTGTEAAAYTLWASCSSAQRGFADITAAGAPASATSTTDTMNATGAIGAMGLTGPIGRTGPIGLTDSVTDAITTMTIVPTYLEEMKELKQVVVAPPTQPVQPEEEVVAVPETPATIYMQPLQPRKPDRN